MKQAKRILTNGFFILTLYLVIILGILVVVEMSPVSADVPQQPVVSAVEEPVYYQPLQSADVSAQRDITQQRFAPLDVEQK